MGSSVFAFFLCSPANCPVFAASEAFPGHVVAAFTGGASGDSGTDLRGRIDSARRHGGRRTSGESSNFVLCRMSVSRAHVQFARCFVLLPFCLFTCRIF